MRPDAEKVVGKYLRSHPDVMALGTRVRSTTPETTGHSWVKLVQLGGAQAPNDPTDHLVECYFQLDCYAGAEGGIPEAVGIARTICEALTTIERAQHDDAVVTAGRISGQSRIPDPDLMDSEGNDRERVVLTAYVYMHP